jgi:hypothetical protein
MKDLTLLRHTLLALVCAGALATACDSGDGGTTDTLADTSAPDATGDSAGSDTTAPDDTAVADTAPGDTAVADTAPGDTSTTKPPNMGTSCDLASPKCGNLMTCKAWTDGKPYCFCPDDQEYQGGLCSGDLTGVKSMCAYTQKDCTGEGFCFDVTSTTCDYLAEKLLDNPGCAELDETGNQSAAVCVSHITDKASPYHDSAECPLVQYWSNPSDFPIDCRCAGKFEDLCKRPYNLEPKVSFGQGPRMRDLASTVQAWNGVLVGDEWYVAVGWSTASKKYQTMIFAIDIETGDRRHVSGAFNDPSNGYTEVGAGPQFITLMDMKLGKDGMLYGVGAISDIGAPKVYRIDPTTGDRELLFDEESADPGTLCPNGSTLPGKKVLQMIPEGWAMDDDYNFYFAYINMPGRGVAKFPKDFSKCEFLTRVPDANQSTTLKDPVGAGYSEVQFQMRAFEIAGGKLYAVSDTKLLEVDLATGNRKLISNGKDVGGLGAGPINAEALGDRWTRWDPYRNVLWTYGIKGASGAIAVDLTTGDRTTWPCWHPTLGKQGACGNTGTPLIPGYLSFGGMMIDPAPPHDLYFAHDLFSVVKYEIKTGNSYILSL